MKKQTWVALILALALVGSCAGGAFAAYGAETVTVEAIAAANSREALLAAHESIRLDVDDMLHGEISMVYNVKDYYYYLLDEDLLYDDAGVWRIKSDDSGSFVLYEWDAFDGATSGRLYLTTYPVINIELFLGDTIEAVHDNGDGTLLVTLASYEGSFAELLETNDMADPFVPADAREMFDLVLDAETLEIIRTEDYGLRSDGERQVLARTVVTLDAPEPEGAAAIRAASAAFRAGAPENPRTITVIYDYGTAGEESYSLVADRSFTVLPVVYYGYELHYAEPERLTVLSGDDGVSDATIYAYRRGAYLYRHDPRLNPRVLADAVADENAVYGFRPSETGSLKAYAGADWTDPEVVASGRADRIAYHESLRAMYDILDEMRAAGEDIETIARAVSAKRNELRLAACGSEEELAATKARNLEKYGHEEGPQADELYEKYGSWETVLTKAFSTNAAMDACLGLYDDCYDLYLAAGQLSETSDSPARRQYAVAAFVDVLAPWAEDAGAQLSDFADAADIDASFLPEWETAVGAGLVKGYEDGTLRPRQTIRRIEAFVLLSRFLPELEATGEAVEFTDVPDWARADIDRLSAAGLLLGYGDGTLGAEDLLTVEQLYTILQRAVA